jgi:hypothetical protein
MCSSNGNPVIFYLHCDEFEYKDLAYALFELCCRASIKFRIIKWSGGKNNRDTRNNFYLSTQKNSDKDVFFLGGSVDFVETDFGDVLGVYRDDYIDVVSGAVKLLNFGFEDASVLDKYQRISKLGVDKFEKLNNSILENSANYFMGFLREKIQQIATVKSPWHGKVIMSVTHDVDGPFLKDSFALLRSLLLSIKGNTKERKALVLGVLSRLYRTPDPYEMFNEWLKVGKKWERQTFYFYHGDLDNCSRHRNDPHYDLDKRMIKHIQAIKEKGMEVGLHTGINSHNFKSIVEAKHKIEEITQSEIYGVRSHYWSGVWQEPFEYWRNLNKGGFLYDASLHPMTLGFRSGISLPIIPGFKDTLDLSKPFIVLPTPIMDLDAVVNRNSMELESTIKSCKDNGLAILDWHVRVLSNIGPWKGYPEELFSIISAFQNDKEIVFMSAEEIARLWLSHAEECYLGNER